MHAPARAGRLAEQGCDLAEGFLFDPALPASVFEDRLRAQEEGQGLAVDSADIAAGR